jgi:succinoglycan biosynthesis transport protein ExoP
MARSNDKSNHNGPGDGTGPHHPVDPLAKNPADADKPGETIRVTEVHRRDGASGPAADAALIPDRPWGWQPRGEAPPSAADLLVSILRFKWTIVIVSVLVSAPIVAAVWTQIVPRYEARAEVRVRPIIPRLVFRTDDNGAIPFYDSFVNTQVSIIRSLTVLQRVLDQPEIQKTEWYRNAPQSLMERVRGRSIPAIERLRDGLSARPRSRTEIVDVSFMDPSAKDAKLIVDTALQQYMKYTEEQSSAIEDDLYRQLTVQSNALNLEIQSQEKTCTDLCRLLGTDTPQELISSKRVRLDETQARLSELQNRIAALEWQRKQIGAEGDEASAAPANGMKKQPKYYQDEEWRRLDLDVKRIQHQMANSIQGPNHPGRLRLVNDLKFAEELLRQRETQLDEQWQERLKDVAGGFMTTASADGRGSGEGGVTVEYQLALAKHEEQLLRAESDKQQGEFKSLFETAQSLERDNTELRHKRELYDAVRQRLDQKNIERNVPGSIKVSMWAYSPTRPANDRRIVYTAMALALGFGMGGGAAFLRASRNQAIYTAKDLPQPMQAPFLGHIPSVRLKKAPGRLLCGEIEQNQVLLNESIRILRTALLSRLDGQGSAAVLVTSANEGTGKSSSMILLGKSIAQAGKKVLIVDADLHKMTLSKRFSLLDMPGLIEFLRDKTIENLPIYPTKTPGLDIMPAGKRSEKDSVYEEIANGAFGVCIRRLLQPHGYDIVLLDCSPILPVADAVILAGQVDGVIMVEREYVSHRTDVLAALARLGTTKGRLLGTVFIGSSDNDHYGYTYRYSGYHNRTVES